MLSWLLCALDVWEVGCRIVCWTLWLKFGWWVLAKNILTRSAFFILKNWFISVMHFPLILTVIFVGSVLICFMLCCWCWSVFLFCFVVYWFVIVVYFKIVFSFGLCFCLVYFWFGFCGVVAVFVVELFVVVVIWAVAWNAARSCQKEEKWQPTAKLQFIPIFYHWNCYCCG